MAIFEREAVRDMVRAREDAVREQRNARHRLKALLLRNGVPYAGRSSWGAGHLRWLASLKLPQPAQQIALEYLHAITEAGTRIARLEQVLRGVQLIVAVTLVAEIHHFWRFPSPRQLMAYLGLVPGEQSGGPSGTWA
jgi:transposase